jgi:hypothetical protein
MPNGREIVLILAVLGSLAANLRVTWDAHSIDLQIGYGARSSIAKDLGGSKRSPSIYRNLQNLECPLGR